MKSLLVSVAVVVLVFSSVVWLIDSVQNVESFYETYQKLKEAEVMNRGWVSRVIPTSSYDIHERRGLDGKIVAVDFRFQPGDIQNVESGCAVLPHDDQKIRRYRCSQAASGVILTLGASGEGQVRTK